MDISIRKTFICFILLLSFILIGCSRLSKNNADEVVIKVGDFIVNQQQFENQIKKLREIQEEWTQEDVTLFLLDNYISAGLLVETAKKLNYEQRCDFINNDSIYQAELVIKYSKQLRANKSKPQHRINENIIKMILENETRIDYIRIPKKEEELTHPLLLYFTNGTNINNILEDPEATTWDNKGLSFYQDISLKHAILTEKVIEEIMVMQENEVKSIKTNSAYYLVRFLKSEKSPKIGIEEIDDEPILQNLLRAQCVENGDDMFDSYRFEKSIQYNEKLLSRLDFSIESFHADGDFIVEINGRFIKEDDIKEKISELPVKIQSLFINKTTRIRAIATLILLNYYQEEKPDESSFHVNDKFQETIFNAIRENAPEDTIAFLKRWIENEYEKYITNESLICIYPNHKEDKNIQPKEKSEKISDWLQPYKLNGYNQLKFDFEKIDRMEITQKNTIDDQVLAYSDNWSITVRKFKEELDRLTPITRLDIANNNLLREMIEYLARKESVVDSKLTINFNLFESIDIMGRAYDQLNYAFDENSIVGRLENIDLSVKELRTAVLKLSEHEKNRFLNLSTRKQSFNEIIAEKFWLNLYDRKTIEDNPNFRKEVSKHQNKLLAELLYKYELQVNIPQIEDERLNIKIQQAVKLINEDKLFSYIQTVMQDYPIQINGGFFQKNLNLDIETSKYNKVIIKNIN